MTDTLFGVSRVSIYGESVTDMDYKQKKGESRQYFVRVFGFRFEGNYYGLDAPAILLLEGTGKEPDDTTPENIRRNFSSNIREWVCDKSDHSARLDEFTGSIEDILLEAELGGGAGRVSGGRVSGGRVSGGRVSGGRVSGGKVD